MKKEFTQSIKEEIVNSITHGIGSILSIFAFVVLLYNAITKGTCIHIVTCSIYGASLITLYSISTIYHAIQNINVKYVFRILDHISIYLLIAGTYLPITLIILKGSLGWIMFAIEYGLCLLGIIFKIIFKTKLSIISVLFYLFMGWLAIIAIKPIYLSIGILWLFLGGIFYTLGVIFFAIDKKVSYFHAVWHIFVLAGSYCHFNMIYFYVIPFS